MAKETYLYSCRQVPMEPITQQHAFQITKLSEDDLEVLATYKLTETRSGTLHCDCPAHKPWCRHCDMLRKFQAEGYVDKGYLYSFDRKEWVPPAETVS